MIKFSQILRINNKNSYFHITKNKNKKNIINFTYVFNNIYQNMKYRNSKENLIFCIEQRIVFLNIDIKMTFDLYWEHRCKMYSLIELFGHA